MKWRIAVIALAAAALAAPLPPHLIERYYSSAVFPRLQAHMTAASNLTAVAWFDLLVVVVGATVIVLAWRDATTRSPFVAAGRIVMRLLTIAASVYLVFLLMWGLNYRRQPLRERLSFHASSVTPAAALALAQETVSRLNAMHAVAHAEGWTGPGVIDPTLALSLRQTVHALGASAAPQPGRPKHSMLDLYFRRAGVAGMTDPFFLETLVASDLLPFERPQVIAHEWAHLAGVTDEGEANFVGWLACVRGAVPHRYSGWLFLYGEVADALPREAMREVSAALAAGPREDLRAIRERYEREVSVRVSRAGWQVYDRYLKANRIEAGAKSYGEVVQLILGTGLR